MSKSALEASRTFARMPTMIGGREVTERNRGRFPSVRSASRPEPSGERRTFFSAPAIAHAVDGFDRVEFRIDGRDLLADALDVRSDRAFVDDHVRVAHQLPAALHVSRQARERMHDPELRDGELDG